MLLLNVKNLLWYNNFPGTNKFKKANFSPTPHMKDKSNQTLTSSTSLQNNKNTWLKTNHSKQSATKVNCFE